VGRALGVWSHSSTGVWDWNSVDPVPEIGLAELGVRGWTEWNVRPSVGLLSDALDCVDAGGGMCIQSELGKLEVVSGDIAAKQHQGRNNVVKPILDGRVLRKARITIATPADLLPSEPLEHALHVIVMNRLCCREIVADHYWNIV
jgi:hypothetical protein